jgi:hypothetical protein
VRENLEIRGEGQESEGTAGEEDAGYEKGE